MKPAGEFLEQLRADIVGRLHAGLLRPGDRLPSIRDVAERTGIDHRVVARVYRELEAQGTIEIRQHSGVFVAATKAVEASEDERTEWAADVLLQSWERGLSRSHLFGLLGGSVSSRLRCGCLESNEDHMVALRAEVELGFSVEVVPLFVEPSASPDSEAPAGTAEVDLLVTSVFHSEFARSVGARAGLPVVVLSFGPAYTAEVAGRAARGPITTVMVDPRYAERARAYLTPALREVVTFVPVEEVGRRKVDLNSERVMATRAARRKLGLEDYHLVESPATLLSRESAAELSTVIARMVAARPG